MGYNTGGLNEETFQQAAKYATNKIKELGFEIYLYDPAKTVSQPTEQLEHLLGKYFQKFVMEKEGF